MPHSLPGRPSDAGPLGRTRCPVCQSRKWATLADCAVCQSSVCSECPGATFHEVGVICAGCFKVYLGAGDVRIPEIDALRGGLTVARMGRMAARLAEFLESYVYPVGGRERVN